MHVCGVICISLSLEAKNNFENVIRLITAVLIWPKRRIKYCINLPGWSNCKYRYHVENTTVTQTFCIRKNVLCENLAKLTQPKTK